METGRKVDAAFSKTLVQEIQKTGLVAERAADFPPTTGTHLLIHVCFLSTDQGNRTERVLIGFGTGRSDVEADARTLAKQVSKELGPFFVRQKWTRRAR